MNAFSRHVIQRWRQPAIGALLLTLLALVASCGGSSSGDASTGAVTSGTANSVVAADNSAPPTNAFAATLLGAAQVPLNLSTAMGTGVVLVDPVAHLLRASVTTAGISGTDVHIRVGVAGSTGPIVFALTETALGSGIWTTETSLSDVQIDALKAGGYYFNVVSSAFPDGEIRGQIVQQLPQSSQTVVNNSGNSVTETTGTGVTSVTGTDGINTTDTTVTSINDTPVNISTINGTPVGNAANASTTVQRTMLTNVLTGSQQVPPRSSTAAAISVVIIDHVAKTLTTTITSMGITGSAAHAHQALAGAAGAIIFPLAQTTSASGIWVAKNALTDAQIKAVAEGGFYLDIHTSGAPDGAIRGQIVQSTGGTVNVINAGTTDPAIGDFNVNDITGNPVATGNNSAFINSGNQSSIAM